LITGKRNNPIDFELEEALSLVLEEKMRDDQNKISIIQEIIETLRNSGRGDGQLQKLIPISYRSYSDRPTSNVFENENYLRLMQSLRGARTIEIVMENMFATYLFSYVHCVEMCTVLWNAIINNDNPNIRLYVPWKEAETIWFTIKEYLPTYLSEYVLPLINNIDSNNKYRIPIEKYRSNPLVLRYFEAKKSGDQKAEDRIIDSMLKDVSSKDSRGQKKTKCVIIGLKLPKRFGEPHFVFDPAGGNTKLYAICARDNGPDIFEWGASNVYQWLIHDKELYQDIYKDPKKRDEFTKLVRYNDAIQWRNSQFKNKN